MMEITDRLNIGDAERLAEWFQRHMTQGQRTALMTENPLLYARIFRNVPDSTILDRVAAALAVQREAYDAQLGAHLVARQSGARDPQEKLAAFAATQPPDNFVYVADCGHEIDSPVELKPGALTYCSMHGMVTVTRPPMAGDHKRGRHERPAGDDAAGCLAPDVRLYPATPTDRIVCKNTIAMPADMPRLNAERWTDQHRDRDEERFNERTLHEE